jgi:O-antigen ligase
MRVRLSHIPASVAVFVAWPLLIVPGTTDPFHPPKLLALAAIVAAAGIAAMVLAVRAREDRHAAPAFLIAAGAWVCWTAWTISWSAAPWDGWLRLLTQGFSVALAFVLLPLVPSDQRRPWFVVMAFGSAMLAAWGLAQYAGWDFPKIRGAVYPDWRHRITASMGNPNLLANWLACTLPPTLALVVTAPRPVGRVGAALLAMLQTAGLAVTFTLGALGALIAGLFAGVLVHRRAVAAAMRSVTPAAAGLALCCLILPMLFFLVGHPAHPVSIPQQAFASQAFRNGMRNRLLIWEASAPMVAEEGPLGVGVGGFARAFPRYRGRVLGQRGEAHDPAALDAQSHRYAHNDVLHEAAETGLPGAVLLMAALIIGFAAPGSLRTGDDEPGDRLLRAGAWTGALVGSFHALVSFPFRIVPNSAIVWLLLVLAWAPASRRSGRARASAGAFVAASLVTMAAVGGFIFLARDTMEQRALFRLSEANRSGQHEAALRAAHQAARIRSDSEGLRYIAGRHAARREYAAAEEAYCRLIGRFDEIGLRSAQADVLRARGKLHEAAEQRLHALALNPYGQPLRLQAISAAVDAGDVRRALELLGWFDDHPADDGDALAALRERVDRAQNAW